MRVRGALFRCFSHSNVRKVVNLLVFVVFVFVLFCFVFLPKELSRCAFFFLLIFLGFLPPHTHTSPHPADVPPAALARMTELDVKQRYKDLELPKVQTDWDGCNSYGIADPVSKRRLMLAVESKRDYYS